jgi:hypothetical protein
MSTIELKPQSRISASGFPALSVYNCIMGFMIFMF